jgi:glycosyltransferase involved in cell wall biosynthesis
LPQLCYQLQIGFIGRLKKFNLVGAAFSVFNVRNLNIHKMPNTGGITNDPKTDSQASGLLITVAICTHNRVSFLQRAVESVLPQMTDETELLIVDNASTDNTAEVATRLAAGHPRLTVCRENEIGVSAARNTALKKAHGQYVLFLDDDATVEPGWLAAYQSFLSAPPSDRIAVVGGMVFPEFEVPPPKWIDLQMKLDLCRSPKRFPYRASLPEGNSAYRRSVAMEVGMFDIRLGPKGETRGYREGSDINLRLQDAGYEIWWLPDAAIRHVMHADRLNLRWVMYSAFKEGQSVAIQRLNEKKDRMHRALFHLARLAGAPFHFTINLLATLFLWPFNPVKAAGLLKRSAIILGFACQLTKEIPQTIISSK